MRYHAFVLQQVESLMPEWYEWYSNLLEAAVALRVLQ